MQFAYPRCETIERCAMVSPVIRAGYAMMQMHHLMQQQLVKRHGIAAPARVHTDLMRAVNFRIIVGADLATVNDVELDFFGRRELPALVGRCCTDELVQSLAHFRCDLHERPR